MYKCCRCKELKSAECFTKNKRNIHRDGLNDTCKPCQKITSRKSWLKNTYGISVEQYEEMLSEQNGRCAICLRELTYKLVVDHCHKSGKVRGLLCILCNRGLSLFHDSAGSLSRAAKYITKSQQDSETFSPSKVL